MNYAYKLIKIIKYNLKLCRRTPQGEQDYFYGVHSNIIITHIIINKNEKILEEIEKQNRNKIS